MSEQIEPGQVWRRKRDGVEMRVIENPTEFGGRYSGIEVNGARIFVVRDRIPARYDMVQQPGDRGSDDAE